MAGEKVAYLSLAECIHKKLCWWCTEPVVRFEAEKEHPHSIPTPPMCERCDRLRVMQVEMRKSLSHRAEEN